MDGYGAAAFMSLYNRQNRHDAAKEEMTTLMMMDQQLSREKLEKEQAQLKDAAYMNEISVFADKLLGPDRDKINAKAKMLQARMREQISTYGGDMQKFFENGGHTAMNDYRNSLIMSPEVTTYMKNKENADMLLKIQFAGKGAQIHPKDFESLQNYYKNGGGEITYTGMLNEIKMPDPEAYPFGQAIPAKDILDSNRVAIYGNYKMYFPDKPEPKEEDLLAFTELYYKGVGKNYQREFALKQEANRQREAELRIMSDLTQKRWELDAAAGKKGGGYKTVTNPDGSTSIVPTNTTGEPNNPADSGYTHTVTASWMQANATRGAAQTTVKEYMESTPDQGNADVNEYLEKLPMTEWALDLALAEDQIFFDIAGAEVSSNNPISRLLANKYALANAYRIKGAEVHKKAIAQWALGEDVKMQGDLITSFNITDDMYLPAGVQVKDNDQPIDKKFYNGTYQIDGIAVGATVTNKKGGTSLLVQQVDKNGVPKETTEQMLERYTDKNNPDARNVNGNNLIIKMSYVGPSTNEKGEAITQDNDEDNPTGAVFYKVIPMNSVSMNKLGNLMGASNDLSKQDIDMNNQTQNVNYKTKLNEQEVEQLKESWDFINANGHDVFSPIVPEVQLISPNGMYDKETSDLVKSYYVASVANMGVKLDSKNTVPLMNVIMADDSHKFTNRLNEYKAEGLDVLALIKSGKSAINVIDEMLRHEQSLATKSDPNDFNIGFTQSWKNNLLYAQKYNSN